MEVATAIEKGILSVFPFCEVVKVPVADGGDGTVETLIEGTNGFYRKVTVRNPLMQPIEAQYGITGNGKTAIIELAAASGLSLIPPNRQNPMLTTSYGMGELIVDALQQGCTDFIVGIGGSATNDAGTGMLQALGYKFLDASGKTLGQGGEILEHIAAIDVSSRNSLLDRATFKVACDVDNPFSGKQGAAYIYAPQKGADLIMIERLDKGLKHFASIIQKTFHKEVEDVPGAGAAGGIGGGMFAFLNATLQSGIELIMDHLRLDEQLKGADWVITGEGKIDTQTGMGKAIQGIASAAARQKIPVIVFSGHIENYEVIKRMGICAAFSIAPGPMSLEKAMDPVSTKENLYRTAEQLFAVMK